MHRNFSIRRPLTQRFLHQAALLSIVFFSAFIITLGAVSIFTPQQSTNAERSVTINDGSGHSLTLTSAGNINMSSSSTAEGTYVSGLDNLNIQTDADGYQLYLSMVSDDTDSNRLYKDGDNTATDYLAPVSGAFNTPTVLQNNTWGYAIPGSSTFDATYTTPTPSPTSKWAAVPLRSSAQLINSSTTTSPAPGTNVPVYYGVKATTALPNGIYSNTIAYTAILSGGSIQDIATISPERTDKLSGGEQVTITTSLNAAATNIGTVTVTIGGETCTNPTVTNGTTGNVIITCNTPALASGKYDITINIPTYNKTFFIPEGIEYYSDVPPATLATITNMQDMTPEVCTNSVVGDEAILTDIRDNNTYVVRKLADNRCWMVQNLRLGGSSAITLTPADSNVTANWTLPASTSPFSTDHGAIQINTTRNNTWTNGTTVNTSGTPPSQTQYVGVYYSWPAATAGSGTASMDANEIATQSVCPKGWRLPTGGAINTATGNGEFQQLYDAYGNYSNFISATSAVLSGYWHLSWDYSLGSTGEWWSRTASSTASGYALSFGTSSVYPQYASSKYGGRSVRCIADDSILASIDTMQDMTTEICTKAPIGDEKILRDTRDGNTYTVRKMPDNKCWMTQNLRLGSTSSAVTLTPTDSDVTSNFTIPTSAVQTSGSTDWGPSNNETAVNTTHVYNNGNRWIQPTSSGNKATVNTTGTPPSQSQYIGNYYNWYTATAGTGIYSMASGEAPSSICPKGWKLPTGGANSDITGLTSALVNIATDTGSVPAQSFTMQSAPNYFVLSGDYPSGVYSQGSYGYWWSRTANSSTFSYRLYLATVDVYPQGYYSKHYGHSVRCIAQ